MFNLASFLIGVFAAGVALVGLLPLLGWLNWFAMPMGFVGLILGVLSSSRGGRNLNIAVMLVAALRLMLGGGLL